MEELAGQGPAPVQPHASVTPDPGWMSTQFPVNGAVLEQKALGEARAGHGVKLHVHGSLQNPFTQVLHAAGMNALLGPGQAKGQSASVTQGI